MIQEAEQIKKLRAQKAAYTTLAEKRASQIPLLEQAMFEADSIESTLRLNSIIERMPARIIELSERAQKAEADAATQLAATRAKLEKMSLIPALAAKYEAFKAEIDALDQVVVPTTSPEPANQPPKPEGTEAISRRTTRTTDYLIDLPEGPFTTRSNRSALALRKLLRGPVSKEDMIVHLLSERLPGGGNTTSAAISHLNRELASSGIKRKVISVGPRGNISYELVEINEPSPADLTPPTNDADESEIPAATSTPVEIPWASASIPVKPVHSETAFDQPALTEDPAEDEASLTAVRDALGRETKNQFTAGREIYERRDLIFSFEGEEITIKNAPGVPANIVLLIQAGVNTRRGLAQVIYPEDTDIQHAMTKISANFQQGVSRLLFPHNIALSNLTSNEDRRNGIPSQYGLVRIPEEPEPVVLLTAESLVEESTRTLELTDYEAGVISNLFREKLVIEKIAVLGIPVLSVEQISAIQEYIPDLPAGVRISSLQMNTIRLNILNKLQEIHDQGLDKDIFDRSGLGVNELLLYLSPLPKEQRNQVLGIVANYLTQNMINSREVHKYGRVIPESHRQYLVDLGPAGRPTKPGEATAKPRRARLPNDARGSLGLAGFVRSGDIYPTQPTRDSRHRVIHAAQPITSEPAYTDQVIARGPQAIREVRAQAVAATDKTRAQVAAIEAAEIIPVKRQTRPERFPREYDALLRHNPESLTEIGRIISSVLADIPELMSNPRGVISPGRLAQVYNNLTTTTLNQYEEMRVIQPNLVGGKKWYDLTATVKARFYKEIDPMNTLSKRGRKQTDSAVRIFVEKRIAEIVESASK